MAERTEDRGQRTEGNGGVRRRAELAVGNEKSFGLGQHPAEHPPDFVAEGDQFSMFLGRKVIAVACEIQGRVRFVRLAITIGQFGNKVAFIAALGPRFAQIQANGSG